MKVITMVGLALLTLGGMAGAQQEAQRGGGGPTNAGNYDTGTAGDPARLYEDVSVTIPAVVAMHLHETSWNIDLANLNGQDCYRAGNHSRDTGRDHLYPLMTILGGAVWAGDGSAITGNNYSFDGYLDLPTSAAGFTGNPRDLMARQTSYPGIVFNNNDRSQVTWKGPMICFNRKIVQKFSNAQNGWTFRATLEGRGGGAVPAGFPSFLMGDLVLGQTRNTPQLRKLAMVYDASNRNSTPLTVTHSEVGFGNTTGGWLDDHILEAIVLDGSETSGTKEARVVFTLTGQF